MTIFEFTAEESLAQDCVGQTAQSECEIEGPRWDEQSQYFGVRYAKNRNKWEVIRRINGTDFHGGLFVLDIDAAKAADELLQKYGGEGKFNFPENANDKVTQFCLFYLANVFCQITARKGFLKILC